MRLRIKKLYKKFMDWIGLSELPEMGDYTRSEMAMDLSCCFENLDIHGQTHCYYYCKFQNSETQQFFRGDVVKYRVRLRILSSHVGVEVMDILPCGAIVRVPRAVIQSQHRAGSLHLQFEFSDIGCYPRIYTDNLHNMIDSEQYLRRVNPKEHTRLRGHILPHVIADDYAATLYQTTRIAAKRYYHHRGDC